MKKRDLLTLFAALFILITLLTIRETNNDQINQGLAFEELRSLSYLAYTREKADETKRGIVKYDPELTFEGYNLYYYSLMDMEGNIVHSWSQSAALSVILENGDILIQADNTLVGKYSWDSRVIWEKKLINHHDIGLSSNNTILIPSREMHEYNGRKVEFDLIIELSQDGEEISRWSTYENFDHIKKFHEPSELDKPAHVYIPAEKELINTSLIVGGDYDYYHLNSIQVLPETPIGKKDTRFQAGNWLLSLCYVNLIVILDKETKEIVWSWGPGELESQHSPIMLDNGNILVYDNGPNRREYTRIIELDPIRKEIVWEYKTNPPELFFSESLGYAQRLPNGNTLITDSDHGRVFEITKEGEIVWEWFNPGVDEEGKRGVIYRMVRYSKDEINKLLELNKK